MKEKLVLEIELLLNKEILFLSKVEFDFLIIKYKELDSNEVISIINNLYLNKSYSIINYSFDTEELYINNIKNFYTYLTDKYKNIIKTKNIDYDSLYFQLFKLCFLQDLALAMFKGELYLSDLICDLISFFEYKKLDDKCLFLIYIIKEKKENGFKLLELLLKKGIEFPELKNKEEIFELLEFLDKKQYFIITKIFPCLHTEYDMTKKYLKFI